MCVCVRYKKTNLTAYGNAKVGDPLHFDKFDILSQDNYSPLGFLAICLYSTVKKNIP